MSFVDSLAAAIQQMEGWGGPGSTVGGVYYPNGTLSYRNNNPGNIRPGTLAVGAIGSSGGYATFPDYATGYAALTGLIQSPMYWNKTLTAFFTTYAPWADNNRPDLYAANVAASLGVDPNTPLSVLAGGNGTTDTGDSGASSSDVGGSTDIVSSVGDAFSSIPGWAWALAGVGIVAAIAL